MFPGASSGDPGAAAYVLYGAPLDRSTSFYPGTRFGPRRIRHHARGFEDYDRETDQHFTELDVVDAGPVRPWEDASAYLSFLAGELVDASGLPIVLGGEHTVSIAGVRASDPDVYVCVDAHLDLRTSFDDDPYSHATTVHHVLETGADVIVIGARSGTREEWDRATSTDRVSVASVEEAPAQVERLRADDRSVHLSIDIDGIDPSAAPATGTPEPFGLSPDVVRDLVDAVAPRVVGADVVEVNDRDEGRTATLAAKLVRRLIFQHAAAHP